LLACLDGGFAGPLAGGEQLAGGALGERLHPHRREQLVSGAQLLTRVQPAALAAQPFAVDKMRAGELGADAGTAGPPHPFPEERRRAGEPGADAGTAEPVDRLTVEVLGRLALAQERA